MRALVTGAGGTVGRVLMKELKKAGHTAIAWKRGAAAYDDYAGLDQYVESTGADTIFHLALCSKPTGMENEGWLVNSHWPSELAWICRMRGLKFVFTSTAMVFTNDAKGPFTLDSEPDANEGYGLDKLNSERRVFHQYPEAHVVRLGWQIGDGPGGNQMIEFLENHQREHGFVAPSSKWYPATSFIPDTAQGLIRVADMSPGLYMLDSNEKWTFAEIVTALNEAHGGKWKVQVNEDFVYDQRMVDPRPGMPPLSKRLKSLR